MNFVVTFILGVIVVGATMWQMSRDDQDEAEDSNDAQATTIEVINGADEESTEEVIEIVAEEATKKIAVEQDDEPESIEIVELNSDESDDASNDASNDASDDARDDSNDDEEAETPVATLQQISGIGPTYAGRISDAGITSIEELSALSAEDLQQIVTPGKSTPTAETEKWLEQARQLAGA